MRPIYTSAARSSSRPRGKWHLLLYSTSTRTICGENARDWQEVDRKDLDPNDICAKCLRDTP